MKSLNITIQDNLYNDISLIAERLFNNNKNNTISTILELALDLDELKLKINNSEISVKHIVSSYKDTCDITKNNKLAAVIAPLKAEFRKNFYLLDAELQDALLKFFNDLKTRYHCKFGTSANISTYIEDNNPSLCFYMNISGQRGQEPIEKYLKFLNDGHYQYRPLEGDKTSYPRNTVWMSRRDQFIRTLRYNSSVSEQFYDKALHILHVDPKFDAVELSAADILKLIGKI